MNLAMKQRLVGTIVLGCLALILIPMLLDGEGMVEPLPMVVSMPSAPEINLTPLPEPERPTIIADSLPVDIPLPDVITDSTEISSTDPALTSDLESAQPNTAQPTLVTTPKLNTQGLPEAWSVKLGMFSDRTNAESLVATLILANHKAYSRAVKTDTQNYCPISSYDLPRNCCICWAGVNPQRSGQSATNSGKGISAKRHSRTIYY